MLSVCLETDIKYKAEQELPALAARHGKAPADKEKGRAFLRPGPFHSQDPRIRLDSAQRCFKKATKKSTTAAIPGKKLRAKRNGEPHRAPTVAVGGAIMSLERLSKYKR
jgi:hypothetical protein